jgi:Mrp family chromosome partitioning ATPase
MTRNHSELPDHGDQGLDRNTGHDPEPDRSPVGADSSPAATRADEQPPTIEAVDRIVAVASAKGGVGKTTVAVSLACALADQERVGLFDADLHGPNVPRLLDVEGPVYADENDDPVPVDADGLEVMSIGLLKDGGPLAWRGAMAHEALSDLFQATAWDDRDTLVVDLPPGPGDVPDPFASMADAVDERLATLRDLSVSEDAVDLRDVPPNRRHEAVEEASPSSSRNSEK